MNINTQENYFVMQAKAKVAMKIKVNIKKDMHKDYASSGQNRSMTGGQNYMSQEFLITWAKLAKTENYIFF